MAAAVWQVHRLVIVDDDGRIEGILSLSDLLHFIILKPSSEFTQAYVEWQG